MDSRRIGIFGRGLFWLIAVTLSSCFSGCGKTESSESLGTSRSTGSESSSANRANRKSGAKKNVVGKNVPKDDHDAVRAVRALILGFREQRPEALWEFFPAGYQRDINDVVHLFAENMDPELWSRSFRFAVRILKVLKQRKAEILAMAGRNPLLGVSARSLSRSWESTLALMETILGSEIADLETMKTIDVGRLLKSTGGELLQHLASLSRRLPRDVLKLELDQLARFQVQLVSATSETIAVLRLSFPETPNAAREVTFVLAEGKWIPQSIAARWAGQIKSIKAVLRDPQTLKKLAENKHAVLKTITELEADLSRLEAAKSSAEFQRLFAISPVAKTVAAIFRITTPGTTGGTSILPKRVNSRTKSSEKITVLVVVQGVTDENIAQKIADKLFDLDNSIDVGDVSVKQGSTMISVSEVADFAAFLQKLRFAEIVSADAKQRKIVIRLRKPE